LGKPTVYAGELRFVLGIWDFEPLTPAGGGLAVKGVSPQTLRFARLVCVALSARASRITGKFSQFRKSGTLAATGLPI
jgi:hypothetical protein